jgi:uncharacterized membrane-anchored protein YjiN (DUF445 family)
MRDYIREARLLDLLEISEKIMKISEAVNFMRYRPHEWLKRDKEFYEALMNEIDKRIAKEVYQGLTFVVYEERPDKVVEVIKRTVEDYLRKWEVDDQIARQIVENVVTKPEIIDKILRIVVPQAVRAIATRVANYKRAAEEALRILGEYDVLDEKSRG